MGAGSVDSPMQQEGLPLHKSLPSNTTPLTSYRPARRAWKVTRNVRALPLRENPRLLRGVWQTMESWVSWIARRSSPESFFPEGERIRAGAPHSLGSAPRPGSLSSFPEDLLLASEPRNVWWPSASRSPAAELSGVHTRRTARKSCRLLIRVYVTVKRRCRATGDSHSAVITKRGRARRMLGSLAGNPKNCHQGQGGGQVLGGGRPLSLSIIPYAQGGPCPSKGLRQGEGNLSSCLPL